MRILHLIYESLGNPFGFGGAGVRAYEIYKRLKDRHDITLLCMKYPGARDGEIEGIRHVFVGTESMGLLKSTLAYTFKASQYVMNNGNRFDVIIEGFRPSTPFFSIYLTKTPVILQLQGIMGIHSLRKFNPFYSFPMYIIERLYPKLYERLIFVTDVNIEKYIKGGKRYAVIPNGVDKELLKVKTVEGNYMLFLSRIDTYTKGLDILLDAFVIVAERFKDIRLILAGHEIDSTERLFKRLPQRLREKVSYVGFVRGEEKIRLLAGAKVFVLPSRHEAHPISVLEAMACGCPVIVSDIPEMRYINDNGLGFVFRSGSATSLAEKIQDLLHDDSLRKRLREKGRMYASNLLWDDVALMFERFLFRALTQ
ncbi:MAG: glycosyltransferase family 4 protein [Thermodesulfovibrionia bacterium]